MSTVMVMLGLLEAVDAVVHADGAFSGLRGRVAIAVAGDDGPAWWTAELGARVQTHFSTNPPAQVPDVVLLLGRETASRMLEADYDGDDEESVVLGDASLLRRFADRYFRRTTGLNHQMLRFQSCTSPREVALS